MASSFKEVLNSGKFVLTSEVAPPKGTNLEKVLHHIVMLLWLLYISEDVRPDVEAKVLQ